MNFESPKWGRSALDAQIVDDDLARARRRRAIIVALIAAAIVLALVLFFVVGRKQSAPAAGANGAAAAQSTRPTVTVIVPGRQQVARVISATGNLSAKRDIPVGVSGEGGRVIRVLVDRGQWVGAGQVLAVIERSVQSEQAAQQAAQIQVARADARLAQSNLDRAMALVSRGFISKADIDTKRATRDAADARVRVAEAQLGEIRARIGLLNIRAPTAGLILDRNVEVGQVVGAGSGALFRMAEGGQMELRAKLAQEDLQRLSVGQPASVTPVGASASYQGVIWQVSPIIDPQTRQGEARVLLPYNPNLRPGGFG